MITKNELMEENNSKQMFTQYLNLHKLIMYIEMKYFFIFFIFFAVS